MLCPSGATPEPATCQRDEVSLDIDQWRLWCTWYARLPVKQKVRVRIPSDALEEMESEISDFRSQT